MDNNTQSHLEDFLSGPDSDDEVFKAIIAIIASIIDVESALAAGLVNAVIDKDALIAEWATGVMSRVQDINAYTAERVAKIIIDGLSENQSVEQIAAEVRSLFSNMSKSRAITIARTESLGASNFAQFQVYTIAGTPFKRWIATMDEKTRDSHASTHNQLRTMNEPFDVDGSPMMFPGDPEGPAKEVINCRCALVPEYAPDRSIWSSEKIKYIVASYDTRFLRNVGLLTEAMRGQFNRQRDGVLRIIGA